MSAAVDVTPTAASKNSANHITTSDVDPAIPRTNAVVAGSDDPAAGSHTLEALSHDLRRRVDAFLDLDTGDAVLRSTQNQVRVAGDVIDEALRRYRCVPYPLRSPPPCSLIYPLIRPGGAGG